MKQQPISLRTRFLRLGLLIAIVKLIAVVTLVWTSTELATATRNIEISRDCSVAMHQTMSTLSHFRRQLLLYRLTGETSFANDAAASRERLEQLKGSGLCGGEGANGRALVAQAEAAVDEYLAAETAAAHEPVESARTGAELAIRDSFDTASQALEGLYELNREAGVRASARADHVQDVTAQAGLVIGVSSIFLVGGLLVLLQRRLVVPTHRLARAIERKDRNLSALEPLRLGLEGELGEIERAVDELSATVVEQRAAQHDFIAAVAHDLKTPLQSIKAYASLLRPGKAPPKEAIIHKGCEVIERQIDKLSRQLDDLLDAASVQSGEFILEAKVFDLADILEESRLLFDTVSDKHRIDVECVGSTRVSGDPLRISQVLTNLLSNAVKYSPNGGSIALSLRHEVHEAVISIRDEGIGIEREQLATLFEPFRRGRGVAKLEIPGVGLGLATSQKIVSAHGGRIEVESEVGRGSTFTIRLPLVEVEADDAAGLSRSEPVECSAPTPPSC